MATATRARARPRRHVEPIAILGGRYLAALGILLAMVAICSPGSPIGNAFERAFGPRPVVTNTAAWEIGNVSEVKVTLITADANRLACAHEQAFDGVHCEFKTDRDRWPKARDEPLDDNKEKVIQPYRTAPGNNLVLLSGLWAHHEVAMRLHREPPAGVPIKQLARFVATCQVKWLGKLDKVRTRWMAGGRWQDDGTAMVGRTESCTVNAM